MKYKAMIFDVDGTLITTQLEYIHQVVGETLQQLGLTGSTQSMNKFWFEGDRNKVIREEFRYEPDLFWNEFRKHDLAELRRQSSCAYNDVDFISELKNKGIKIGIVTGAPFDIAYMNLGLIGTNNFEAIVAANPINGVKSKPDPQGLEQCLDMLGVRNTEAVYVGNADEDIGIARNANVFDVLIDRGEYDFSNIKPSLRVSSLYELRRLVE